MKTKTITILLGLISSFAIGQGSADFEQSLYNSYVNGNIMDWKEIIVDMSAGYRKEKQAELLYSLCFAQYGYIGYCISEDLEKEAKECLKDAMNNVKILDELFQGRHDVLALHGAFLGYKIILSKFSALYLGPKALKLINTASVSSDKYFNCSLEFGNMRFFTPKFLGGSKEEAISYYKKAVGIIENSSEKEEHNWIYINTVLILANAYYETDSKDLACQLYKQILNYEPRASMVRKEMNEKCKN
jgi:tetratricopeptide (TPR) repeat protein